MNKAIADKAKKVNIVSEFDANKNAIYSLLNIAYEKQEKFSQSVKSSLSWFKEECINFLDPEDQEKILKNIVKKCREIIKKRGDKFQEILMNKTHPHLKKDSKKYKSSSDSKEMSQQRIMIHHNGEYQEMQPVLSGFVSVEIEELINMVSEIPDKLRKSLEINSYKFPDAKTLRDPTLQERAVCFIPGLCVNSGRLKKVVRKRPKSKVSRSVYQESYNITTLRSKIGRPSYESELIFLCAFLSVDYMRETGKWPSRSFPRANNKDHPFIKFVKKILNISFVSSDGLVKKYISYMTYKSFEGNDFKQLIKVYDEGHFSNKNVIILLKDDKAAYFIKNGKLVEVENEDCVYLKISILDRLKPDPQGKPKGWSQLMKYLLSEAGLPPYYSSSIPRPLQDLLDQKNSNDDVGQND